MGVAFLKPGSNSARPPPGGGHILYIHDASSVSGSSQYAFLEMHAFS